MSLYTGMLRNTVLIAPGRRQADELGAPCIGGYAGEGGRSQVGLQSQL